MPPAPTRRGPNLDADTEAIIGLSIVGGLAALDLTATTATIVSAAISGGGWVEASWTDHARALVALPWHVSEPAAGYRAGAAADVPGPAVWWTVAGAILTALVAGAIWTGTRLADRKRQGWVKRHELRALRRTKDAIVLGSHHHRRVAVEDRHSTLVIGATQPIRRPGSPSQRSSKPTTSPSSP